MGKEQIKESVEVSSNNNNSNGGAVSQMLMDTPLMQQRTNEHQAMFGETIQKQENNTGLPDNLKSGMESLSGMSLDHVKVHYNSSKPASVQAHAYAQGSDIHIASGQEKHLPHELGHVVQQAEGRVKPTANIGGVAVNDNPSLESEATKMGERALQMKGKNSQFTQQYKNTKTNIIQGKIYDYKGLRLSELTPESIGMTGSLYEILWKSLNNSATAIVATSYDGQSSYDSSTKTLYFKKAIVDDLIDGKIDDATKVSHIATLTHEMSHAHDHIIMGKELTGGSDKDEHTRKVIETEIRAWAAEAYSAYEVWKKQKLEAMDEEKGKLIAGWQNYKSSMLENISKYRKDNHVIGRLCKYIKENMKYSDISEISQWAKDNMAFINKHVIDYREVVMHLLKGNEVDYQKIMDKYVN